MKILSVDLGKFKSVASHYENGEAPFETVTTGREVFRRAISRASGTLI